MEQSLQMPLKITIVTAASWMVSLQEIESLARIGSLLVPIIFSGIAFYRNEKERKRRKQDEEEDN